MSILELQVDALMRLCTAEQESERLQAREEVRRMLETRLTRHVSTDPEYLIRELLLEIGAPDHLVGQSVSLTRRSLAYASDMQTTLRLVLLYE